MSGKVLRELQKWAILDGIAGSVWIVLFLFSFDYLIRRKREVTGFDRMPHKPI